MIIQWSKFDPYSTESEIKAEFFKVYFFCIIMKSLLSVTAHVLFYSHQKISTDHLAFLALLFRIIKNKEITWSFGFHHTWQRTTFKLTKSHFQNQRDFPLDLINFEDKIYHTNIGNAKKFAHKGLIKSANILKKSQGICHRWAL